MKVVPDKPSVSRKGAGGNKKKNSLAYKTMVAKQRPPEPEIDFTLPESEPLPVGTIRKPVWLLDEYAKAVWDDIVPALEMQGRVMQIDAPLLAFYCMDTTVYMKATSRQALQHHMTVEQKKLLVDEINGALKRIMLVSASLGIGWKSREVTSGKPRGPYKKTLEPEAAKELDEEAEKRKNFVLYGTG